MSISVVVVMVIAVGVALAMTWGGSEHMIPGMCYNKFLLA